VDGRGGNWGSTVTNSCRRLKMSSNGKYIGLDVHKEAILIAVLNGAGKLVMESIIEAKATTLVQVLQGLRGELHVTLEEGTWVAWLHDVLKPHVYEIVVCNPRRNALLKEGSKSDKVDGRKLAELLRAGGLERMGLPATYEGSSRELYRVSAPDFVGKTVGTPLEVGPELFWLSLSPRGTVAAVWRGGVLSLRTSGQDSRSCVAVYMECNLDRPSDGGHYYRSNFQPQRHAVITSSRPASSVRLGR